MAAAFLDDPLVLSGAVHPVEKEKRPIRKIAHV